MSMEDLQEFAVGESDGGVISGLERHPAAAFTFSKINENYHRYTKNVNGALVENRGRRI
jgi:hypothetical protein